MIFKILTCCFPWFIRRRLLITFYGFKIHPTAKIGLSWIFPDQLIMEADSYIGHLNVAVNLDMMELKKKSSIGRSNWITGFSTKTDSKHFQHQENRQSKLYVGENAAITKNHHLDCTNLIHIGAF